MKTIIAGSRDIKGRAIVEQAIDSSGFEITEVVYGGCRGVDNIGAWWAVNQNIPIAEFPADWDNITAPGAVVKERNGKKYNALAGHWRNQQMADYADALILVHHNTPGSLDMLERARKRGLKIYEHIINAPAEEVDKFTALNRDAIKARKIILGF